MCPPPAAYRIHKTTTLTPAAAAAAIASNAHSSHAHSGRLPRPLLRPLLHSPLLPPPLRLLLLCLAQTSVRRPPDAAASDVAAWLLLLLLLLLLHHHPLIAPLTAARPLPALGRHCPTVARSTTARRAGQPLAWGWGAGDRQHTLSIVSQKRTNYRKVFTGMSTCQPSAERTRAAWDRGPAARLPSCPPCPACGPHSTYA